MCFARRTEKIMSGSFFALFSRMKYIDRWSLMRNTQKESLSHHSLETAAVAHALAVIGNKRLGKNYNADRVCVMGVYHDMPEIITGDMPTPVKYYNSEIRRAFGDIEKNTVRSLLNTLPEDLRGEYANLIRADGEDAELRVLLKAADKISALIKCIEERRAGNTEFDAAYTSTLASLKSLGCAEADIFIDEFLGAYSSPLDALTSRE